ncbi:hypothetical protein ABFX02_12G140300 [Erythranthe guttata]
MRYQHLQVEASRNPRVNRRLWLRRRQLTMPMAALLTLIFRRRRSVLSGSEVHLSEEEKRNSRAERFGASSAANKLDTSKPLEELKRKSQAERFGIVQSDPSDEEAKKKARQARFESFSKADSVEEDKRKARAVRFSQPDSGSKANGKGNADVKTAIAETADGGT